jgi:hypothetical protein
LTISILVLSSCSLVISQQTELDKETLNKKKNYQEKIFLTVTSRSPLENSTVIVDKASNYKDCFEGYDVKDKRGHRKIACFVYHAFKGNPNLTLVNNSSESEKELYVEIVSNMELTQNEMSWRNVSKYTAFIVPWYGKENINITVKLKSKDMVKERRATNSFHHFNSVIMLPIVPLWVNKGNRTLESHANTSMALFYDIIK